MKTIIASALTFAAGMLCVLFVFADVWLVESGVIEDILPIVLPAIGLAAIVLLIIGGIALVFNFFRSIAR